MSFFPALHRYLVALVLLGLPSLAMSQQAIPGDVASRLRPLGSASAVDRFDRSSRVYPSDKIRLTQFELPTDMPPVSAPTLDTRMPAPPAAPPVGSSPMAMPPASQTPRQLPRQLPRPSSPPQTSTAPVANPASVANDFTPIRAPQLNPQYARRRTIRRSLWHPRVTPPR